MMGAARQASADLPRPQPVIEVEAETGAPIPPDVTASSVPVILRGFVAHWPLVEAAGGTAEALLEYLLRFDRGAVVPVTAGPPALRGRIFYNDRFDGFNADRGNAHIAEVLRRIAASCAADEQPLIYLASATVDHCLPGLRQENDVPFPEADPLASIWIGTRTRIAAHNDLPLNLACVAAGRRRFTLFPPDQTANLYVGPFELTPAGRPISLVDFHAPDLERFPRFAEAMAHALLADLGPGDALFIPSMWWHHVEADAGFNILVNYWWRTVPAWLGTPQDVLNHAMLTLRDLPQTEREIWRHLFEHYVFGSNDTTAEHIPEHARGILSPIDDETARRTRAYLLNRLNR